MARLRSEKERRALVEGYAAMHGGAAASLAPWLSGIDGLAPAAGTPAGPLPPGAPTLGSRAEALGFHYVMEGSALGGRVILRQLDAEGVDTAGLRFLHPHGARTGGRWRALLAVLDRELAGNPGALGEAAGGARKGFAFARACLGVAAPP